jgi:hypothetical protein
MWPGLMDSLRGPSSGSPGTGEQVENGGDMDLRGVEDGQAVAARRLQDGGELRPGEDQPIDRLASGRGQSPMIVRDRDSYGIRAH